MPPDEFETRLRMLESEVRSDLAVRLAVVESQLGASDERAGDLRVVAQKDNIPTRLALAEVQIRALNRFMWLILAIVLGGAAGTNIQLYLLRGGR